MEILWSPQAESDILAIQEYIGLDSPARAVDFTDRLIRSVERLGRFPLSGHAVEDHPAVRQIVFRGYRVIYRVFPSRIEIQTVFGPGQMGGSYLDGT